MTQDQLQAPSQKLTIVVGLDPGNLMPPLTYEGFITYMVHIFTLRHTHVKEKFYREDPVAGTSVSACNDIRRMKTRGSL